MANIIRKGVLTQFHKYKPVPKVHAPTKMCRLEPSTWQQAVNNDISPFNEFQGTSPHPVGILHLHKTYPLPQQMLQWLGRHGPKAILVSSTKLGLAAFSCMVTACVLCLTRKPKTHMWVYYISNPVVFFVGLQQSTRCQQLTPELCIWI